MKTITLPELAFDRSGQSQELRVSYRGTMDAADPKLDEQFPAWVRRMRHYPTTQEESRSLSSDEFGKAGETFLYWLVGEEGQVLTSALAATGLDALLRGMRANEPQELYDRRTNYGAF